MRSVPGSAPTSSDVRPRGGGAMTVSPTPGPRTASSSAAVSRTVRLTQCSTPSPLSSRTGPRVIRPWRRLQADEPAARRRDPDRAAAVAGVGDRHHAGRDRGGRAAARPARRAGRVPRVARRAPRDRLGRRHAAELRAVRATGDDEARPRGTGRRGSCRRRATKSASLKRDVAVAERLPGVARAQVLQQERHAAEGAVGQRRVGGRLAGVVEPADDHRVQHRVDPLDPLDRRLEQFGRR